MVAALSAQTIKPVQVLDASQQASVNTKATAPAAAPADATTTKVATATFAAAADTNAAATAAPATAPASDATNATDANATAGVFSAAYAYVAGKTANVSSTVAEKITDGTTYVKESVGTYAVALGSVTALSGSALAVNSTINLLQKRPQVNVAREIAKVATGAGIVAASMYCVEGTTSRLTVALVAAVTGIAVGLVRTGTDAPAAIRSFILKRTDNSAVAARVQGEVSAEGDLTVKNVSVIVGQAA